MIDWFNPRYNTLGHFPINKLNLDLEKRESVKNSFVVMNDCHNSYSFNSLSNQRHVKPNSNSQHSHLPRPHARRRSNARRTRLGIWPNLWKDLKYALAKSCRGTIRLKNDCGGWQAPLLNLFPIKQCWGPYHVAHTSGMSEDTLLTDCVATRLW